MAPRCMREATVVDRGWGAGEVGSSTPPLPKSFGGDGGAGRQSACRQTSREPVRLSRGGGLGDFPRTWRNSRQRRSAALPASSRLFPALGAQLRAAPLSAVPRAEPEAPRPPAPVRAAELVCTGHPVAPATLRPLGCPDCRGDTMLGMIRNSLFGSVETWPWQVLSKGGKVGPHPEGVGAGSEGPVGQKCARDHALWLLPWARPSMAQHLDWEGGKEEVRCSGAQGSAEEGTHTGEVDWRGESQLGEVDSAC